MEKPPCIINDDVYVNLKNSIIKQENYIRACGTNVCKYMPPVINKNEFEIVKHLIEATIYIREYTISAVDVKEHLRTKLSKKNTNYFFPHVIKEMSKSIEVQINKIKAENSKADLKNIKNKKR